MGLFSFWTRDGEDAAITEARRRLEDNGADLRALKELADALRRANRDADAADAYRALVGACLAAGLGLKAVAACRAVLDLDPDDTETQETLAGLLTKRSGPVAVPARWAVALPPPPPPSSQEGEPVVERERAADSASDDDDNLDALADAFFSGDQDEVLDAAIVATVDAAGRDVFDADQTLSGSDDDSTGEPPPIPYSAEDAPVSEDDVPVIAGDDVDVLDATDLAAAVTVRGDGTVGLKSPPPVPLFSRLSAEGFTALLRRTRLLAAEAGAVLVSEGEPGDSLFVVVRGAVRVERAAPGGPLLLARLGADAFFGEMALVNDRPRAATVTADVDTELLEIPKDAVEHLIAVDPSSRAVLTGFARRRLLQNALLTSPVFAGLPAAVLRDVTRTLKPRKVKADDAVLLRGEAARGLFVVLDGVLEVTLPAGGTRSLSEGDVFGEMSLLSGDPASADVHAVTDCRLAHLPQGAFSAVVTRHPTLLRRVEALSNRRRHGSMPPHHRKRL